MRQFWGNQLDYNDRNDFPAGNRNNPGNPRPTGALVNEFAFGDVNAHRSQHGGDLGQLPDPGHRRRRACRASASRSCSSSASTRTRRRAARAIPSSAASSRSFTATARFNFAVLLKEFFSSPLVTGAVRDRQLPRGRGADQHLAARPPVRGAVEPARQARPVRAGDAVLPTSTQTATARIAASVASDAFSRGAQIAGDAVRPDAVLPRRHRAAVREHRHRRSSTRRPARRLHQHRRAGRDQRHGRDGDGLPARPPAARAGGADPDRTTTPWRATMGSKRRNNRAQGDAPAVDLRPGVRIAAGASGIGL